MINKSEFLAMLFALGIASIYAVSFNIWAYFGG